MTIFSHLLLHPHGSISNIYGCIYNIYGSISNIYECIYNIYGCISMDVYLISMDLYLISMDVYIIAMDGYLISMDVYLIYRDVYLIYREGCLTPQISTACQFSHSDNVHLHRCSFSQHFDDNLGSTFDLFCRYSIDSCWSARLWIRASHLQLHKLFPKHSPFNENTSCEIVILLKQSQQKSWNITNYWLGIFMKLWGSAAGKWWPL